MNIGDNIKRYRKENKISQAKLAELIGKSKSSIEKYEANKVQPSLDTLKTISSHLNIDVGLLLGANDVNRELINNMISGDIENNPRLESAIHGIMSAQEIFETKQMFKNLGYSIDLTYMPDVYITDNNTNKDIGKMSFEDFKKLTSTLKISLNSIVKGFISSFKIDNDGDTDGK